MITLSIATKQEKYGKVQKYYQIQLSPQFSSKLFRIEVHAKVNLKNISNLSKISRH